MKRLERKVAVVTGGSRGLGRGIVNALAAEGAEVWAVARNEDGLLDLEWDVASVQTLAMDVSEPHTASRVFAAAKPDILVLNAGAQAHMAPIHEQNWEQFNFNWETDVKSTFLFGKQALQAPMPPGSQVVTISSGAALFGSPASGGYAGAKRTQWFLSEYFQKESDALHLDIRFTAVLPKQMFGSTELGHHASSGYAEQLGISKEQFLQRFEPALTPTEFGYEVISILLDEAYQDGVGFAINGSGIEKLN